MEHKSRGKMHGSATGALSFSRWVFILDAVIAMIIAHILIWLTEFLYDKYKDQIKMSFAMVGMKIEEGGKKIEDRFANKTSDKTPAQNFEHTEVEEGRVQEMVDWVMSFSNRIQGKAA